MKPKHNYGNSGATARSGAPTTRNDQAAWGRLTDSDRQRWQEVYDEVLAQTGDEQLAALAAWGAVNRARLMGVRSGSSYIVRGWASRFDDGSMPDAYDTYWDENTDYFTDYFTSAPLWMEHGQDEAYGSDPIGKRLHARIYPFGLMLEHVLHEDHPQFAETVRRVESGEYSYSVDGVGHHTRIDEETGHVDQWFLTGCSLTKYPAEPGLGPVSFAEAARALRSIYDHHHKRGNMNILLELARFFGIEEADANEDSVRAEMDALIEDLQQRGMGEGGDEEQRAVDMAALVAALGLPDTATADEVIAALQAILAEVAAPAPEGEAMGMRAYDFDALRSARAAAAQSAPPVRRRGLNQTRDSREERPGERQLRHAPNVNRGVPNTPLVNMIRTFVDRRAHTYQTGPLGGYIVNEQKREEMLPLLRARLVLEQMGVLVTPMEDYAAMDVPKMTAAPTAYWVGTNATVPDSEAQFQTLKLVPKTIAALSRIPMRMLQTSPADAERRITDEIIKSIQLKIDYAALYGAGALTGSNVGAEPLGLVNVTGVTSTNIATNGKRPEVKDFTDMKKRIEADNVELDDSTHWLYHPNVLNYWEDKTDTTGQLLARSQWTKGFEPFTTTQIPTNLTVGSSSDCTDAFLGRWNYMELGLGNAIEITVLTERYADNLQVGILAHTFADVLVHYPEAFEVLRGLRDM